MNKEQSEMILGVLNHIKKRPYMYFRPNALAIVDFLSGFETGLTLGTNIHYETVFKATYKEVILKNGWEWNSMGVWHQMLDKGYDEEKIITELLDIHIAVWEQIAKTENG